MFSLSWVEAHGALTHLPIAFLLAVAFFETGAVLLKKAEWHTVSFWLLTGAVVTAVPALASGWFTGDDLRFTGTAVQPPSIFLSHRLFAFATAGVAIILLIWRTVQRDRLSRPATGVSLTLSLVAAATVAYTGFLGGRMVFGGTEATTNNVQAADNGHDLITLPTTPQPSADPTLIEQGRKLFTRYPCASCHRLDGKGGISGPDLTHEARRHTDIDWHIEHLKNPQKMKANSDMPPFGTLPERDLKALATFLATRK